MVETLEEIREHFQDPVCACPYYSRGVKGGPSHTPALVFRDMVLSILQSCFQDQKNLYNCLQFSFSFCSVDVAYSLTVRRVCL